MLLGVPRRSWALLRRPLGAGSERVPPGGLPEGLGLPLALGVVLAALDTQPNFKCISGVFRLCVRGAPDVVLKRVLGACLCFTVLSLMDSCVAEVALQV